MSRIESVASLRAGHAAYIRGERDPGTVERERAYNAWRKRLAYHRRRAQRMGFRGCGCPVCVVAA